MMRNMLPRLFALCALMAAATTVLAAPAALSRREAEKVLQETFAVATYVELNGEEDYAGRPQEIIRAALFGAFDALMERLAEQDQRKARGEPPLPAHAPLITVARRSIPADRVLLRSASPAAFRGLPEQYTVFADRKAVELAALRYTGHAVTRHMAPGGKGYLGDTILNDGGYYMNIGELGEAAEEPRLRTIMPRGAGYVLRGDLVQLFKDAKRPPAAFTLELTPGDAPGTWKRRYVTLPHR